MSEAGVRLGRDRKKKLISLYAPAVESYSRLEGRHTVFDCENGFRLDALWSKHTRIRALLRGREYGVRVSFAERHNIVVNAIECRAGLHT